jgi:dipeptidase E
MPFPKNTTVFLLSSFNPDSDFLDQVPLSGASVLMITTATLGEGRSVDPEDTAPLEERGAVVHLCDLRTKTTEEVAQLVDDSDVVWLCGGNTFVLLDAMNQTNFGDALEKRGERRPLTCVGESAGAIIFGRSIAHVSSLDDPTQAPNLTNFDALNWIDFDLVPHWEETKYGLGEAIKSWITTVNPKDFFILHETAHIKARSDDMALRGPEVSL